MFQIYINLFQSFFRLSLVIIVEILSYLIILCSLLSPYPCFISLLYLDLYVLGDDALIS